MNNPATLLRGTAGDVEAEVARAVAAGVRVIAPECAVPLHTPTANLQAIAQAARGPHAEEDR